MQNNFSSGLNYHFEETLYTRNYSPVKRIEMASSKTLMRLYSNYIGKEWYDYSTFEQLCPFNELGSA